MTALIFDIDGTLTDTVEVDNKCFIQAFMNVFEIDIFQHNWSELKNVTDWGITEEIIFKNWNRKPITTELENLKLNFVQLLKNELEEDRLQFQEIKGAGDFIVKCDKLTDTIIGFATGGWQESAIHKLNAIGIEPTQFPFSSSSNFKEREAILSDTINQIIESAEKPIERIVYFGDGVWDFLTCEKLRIEFIGIDTHENGKLKKNGVKTVFKDFEQPELIEEYISKRNTTANNGYNAYPSGYAP